MYHQRLGGFLVDLPSHARLERELQYKVPGNQIMTIIVRQYVSVHSRYVQYTSNIEELKKGYNRNELLGG